MSTATSSKADTADDFNRAIPQSGLTFKLRDGVMEAVATPQALNNLNAAKQYRALMLVGQLDTVTTTQDDKEAKITFDPHYVNKELLIKILNSPTTLAIGGIDQEAQQMLNPDQLRLVEEQKQTALAGNQQNMIDTGLFMNGNFNLKPETVQQALDKAGELIRSGQVSGASNIKNVAAEYIAAHMDVETAGNTIFQAMNLNDDHPRGLNPQVLKVISNQLQAQLSELREVNQSGTPLNAVSYDQQIREKMQK